MPFIALELIEGAISLVTLRQESYFAFRSRNSNSDPHPAPNHSLAPLSPEEEESILAGLRAIHAQGVLHADVRLNNVLVSCTTSFAVAGPQSSGKRKFLWVDFGHSRPSCNLSDKERKLLEKSEEADCLAMLAGLRTKMHQLMGGGSGKEAATGVVSPNKKNKPVGRRSAAVAALPQPASRHIQPIEPKSMIALPLAPKAPLLCPRPVLVSVRSSSSVMSSMSRRFIRF